MDARWSRWRTGSCCSFLSGLQFTLIGIKRFLNNLSLGFAGERDQALKLLPLQERDLKRTPMIRRQATAAKPVAFNVLFNVTPRRSCSNLWRSPEKGSPVSQ